MSTLLPDVMNWSLAGPYLAMALAFGYLLGSIPFGVLSARAFGLGDLRKVGSGNIGATNVLRTGSKGAAAATLALDLGKGWLAVVIARAMWGDLPAEVAGIGAFLGHCFPVWLKFRGGKGVATFLGVMFGFGLAPAALTALTWLAVAALTRISSAGALGASLSAPVWLYVLGIVSPIWATLPMIAVLWLRHAANIGRLIRGEEPKIGKR